MLHTVARVWDDKMEEEEEEEKHALSRKRE